MKRLLLTGQVGLAKENFLNEVKIEFDKKDLKFNFESLGQKMIKLHTSKINERKILNLPKDQLDQLRRIAWMGILDNLSNLMLIFLHLTLIQFLDGTTDFFLLVTLIYSKNFLLILLSL